jgi:hypothetical protein
MLTGNWKSFEELEECLTIEELYAVLEGARKKEHRELRALGIIIQDIDIDAESKKKEIYDPAKEREFLASAGIGYESDAGLESELE